MLEGETEGLKAGASVYSVLAAPGDGRTPIASPPPSLRDYGGGEKRLACPGQVWYKPCVTPNTITIRLRRPRAEIEAKAKPNLNAWVNKLIEQAIGPRNVDWNEHFDRPPSARKFRYSAQVRRAER